MQQIYTVIIDTKVPEKTGLAMVADPPFIV